MRSIGLDVHRDFCEVVILDGRGGRRRGRVASTVENLQLFAQSLAPDDKVQAPGPEPLQVGVPFGHSFGC